MTDTLKDIIKAPKEEKLVAGVSGETPTKDVIEVSRSDFQGLIATVTKLQNEVSTLKGDPVDLPTVKTRTAKIHLYKNEIITKTGKAWEVLDTYGQPEMRLEVFVGDKKHEVRYKDFSTDDGGFTSERAAIKEIKTIDEGVEIQGYTDLVEVEYRDFRSVSKGRVPIKVVTPKYMYIMKRESGEEVELNPNALN